MLGAWLSFVLSDVLFEIPSECLMLRICLQFFLFLQIIEKAEISDLLINPKSFDMRIKS